MPFLNDSPEWATNNPVDGVSGQPAIIEPSAGKISSGYTRLERPPRQDFNWQANQSGIFLKKLSTMFNGYIDGFRLMEVLAAIPAINVKVGHGLAMSNNNEFLFDTSSDPSAWTATGLTKDISAAFTPGNAVGGLASNLALIDQTFYHFFIIRLSDGSIDAGWDSDPAAANLISADGATHFRRVFTNRYFNVGTGLERLLQYGDYFLFTDQTIDGPDALIAPGASFGFGNNINAPTGITTLFDMAVSGEWSAGTKLANFAAITGDKATAGAVLSSYHTLNVGIFDSGDFTQNTTVRMFQDGIVNNMSAQIDVITGTASLTIHGTPLGYWDTRGKDWGNGVNPADNRGLFFG